jgi:tetratricopeptide (TPR) repeat protein
LAANTVKHPGAKLTWATVGLYYEYAGDYQRASAAYALAYRQKPTTALAYAAARSAESAGDIDRALDYYATVLDAHPADNR